MCDKYYMNLALIQAKKALKKNEVPVGAIVVDEKGNIIGKGYNKKEKHKSVCEHAEIIAITKASKKIKSWRLNNCSIYTTLEPCPMCASAIEQSRIKKVYYGTSRKDENNKKIINNILKNIDIQENIYVEECAKLLSDFFKNRR